MSHFMIVSIPYINLLKPFLDNKMSIFEEYGAFKEVKSGDHVQENLIIRLGQLIQFIN